MRNGWTVVAAISAAAVLQAPVAAPSLAEVTRVVVEDSGPMGTFGGRDYLWVTAHMEGTVARDDGTTGHYRVPVQLYYPDRNGNGFGFVDVPNNADFASFFDENAAFGKRQVFRPGAIVFDDFLQTEGFAYISVQWHRMVTAALGPEYGVIENGLDGYEIVRDAARMLRDPSHFEGELAFGPEAVDHVIGYGYSNTSGLLKYMAWQGEDREPDGLLLLDGHMLAPHNGVGCNGLTNDETPRDTPGLPSDPNFRTGSIPCPDLPGESRIITLRAQGDADGLGPPAQVQPGSRVYDMASVSHIPTAFVPLINLGASRQNPVSWAPVAKAMLRHLVGWITDDAEPPPPRYLAGTFDSDGGFHVATDADGNVLGGIRLPNVATELPNGERAGAPLGVYGGHDEDLRGPGYGYAHHGGTFDPFSAEELARRYPTQEVYVDLVEKAAATLLADGYILEEDYEAYVRDAERHSWPLEPGRGPAWW